MPIGPQGQKRPADAVGAAVTVAKIATLELEEEAPPLILGCCYESERTCCMECGRHSCLIGGEGHI